MAKQTGRSLRLSKEGIQKADIALKKFAGKRDLAAQLGMSPTTVTNFFAGRTVKRREFHEICKKLRLDWQEVAYLPQQDESEPLQEKQDKGSDIDELVREVRSRLRNDIQRLHGQIPLYGVDGLVPLGELFVNVNILEQRSSSRRSELDDLWEDFISEAQDTYGYRSFDRMGIGRNLKCVAGDKVLEKENNLMVVGKPGSGKTTYLQHIVIKCNDGLLQPHRIPVLIKLRDFVKDGRRFEYCLKHYLCWQWGLSEDNTEQVLKDGKALILLDGLDEVTGTDGQAIVEQIEYFTRTYPQNQLVVTSRTQCQTVGFGQFEYVEVDNFNKAQVQDFADRWFKAITSNTQEGEKKARQFLDKLYLQENHQIRELAITPILLSLTCSVFYYRGKFYSQRSKLYQEAIELLLERWDKDRKIARDEIYRELSPERKQQLLCYLAATNFTKTKYYILFEKDEIEDYIANYLNCSRQDSKAVLRAMEKQHGLLIERAQGFWSFSHLTFQEYFTAKWFCDRDDWEGLAAHVGKKHWREVFLLAVGRAKFSEKLLQLMKQEIEAIVASDETLKQVLNWINEKSFPVEVLCKPASVRAFYLSRSLELPFDHHLSCSIDLSFDQCLSHSLNLFCDYCLYRSLHHSHFPDFGKTLYSSSSSNYGTVCCITHYLEFELFLSEALDNSCDLKLELSEALRKLKNKLPSQEARKHYKEWWQAHGQAWIEELRAVMVNHCQIGHNGQFSNESKKLLQQYYDANQLLVDCLNSGCLVNDKLREEIEDNLLLPITESEERQQQLKEMNDL